jgi:hypothetical protein
MVKPGAPRADASHVTSPRALALLAAFASPVLMVAAIAGWLYGLWPATQLTLGISAFAVVGGPLLGILHVMTAKERDPAPEPAAPTVAVRPGPAPRTFVRPAPTRAPLPLTAQAMDARRFHNWRTQPHPAIEHRERERRASQYIRS